MVLFLLFVSWPLKPVCLFIHVIFVFSFSLSVGSNPWLLLEIWAQAFLSLSPFLYFTRQFQHFQTGTVRGCADAAEPHFHQSYCTFQVSL